MEITRLQPIFDSALSFYGKALLLSKGSTVVLKSYDTEVATYNKDLETIQLTGHYNVTIARHIREFCRKFGFAPPTKSQMSKGVTLKKVS